MRYATIRDLSRNPAEVVKGRDPVVITRNGRPLRLLIAFDEDMLLLNEPSVRSSVAKSRAALARGDKGKTVAELLAANKARR